MIHINYSHRPQLRRNGAKEEIFCVVRKRWLMITPEEWVRQNFLNHLINELHYPASLIAVEKQLQLGELKKRFDIIIYKNTEPFMLIECKEMNVPLNENVLQQILRYNIPVKAPVLVITNGSYCIAFRIENGLATALEELPSNK